MAGRWLKVDEQRRRRKVRVEVRRKRRDQIAELEGRMMEVVRVEAGGA